MVFSRGTRRRGCEEGPQTVWLSPTQDSIRPQPQAGIQTLRPQVQPVPGSWPRVSSQPLAAPSSLWPSLRGSALRSSLEPRPSHGCPRTKLRGWATQHGTYTGPPAPFGDWLLERDKSRRPSHYEFLKSAFQFLSRSGFAHEMTECKFKMSARLAKCRLLTRDTYFLNCRK